MDSRSICFVILFFLSISVYAQSAGTGALNSNEPSSALKQKEKEDMSKAEQKQVKGQNRSDKKADRIQKKYEIKSKKHSKKRKAADRAFDWKAY